MTVAGSRIVWAGSLLALAIDVWLKVVPAIPPWPAWTPHRVLMAAVLVGIPAAQAALPGPVRRRQLLKWIVVAISGVWFVASVLLVFEASLLYFASGGLWIAGAADRPRVRNS